MVAVPTPLDWVANAGNFATAAMLKAGVGDPLTFLLDPPRCKIRSVVVQSIPTAAYTSIAMATEDYDNEATAAHLSGTGMHDTVTNNSRITIRTAGTYLITGQVGFAGNTTGRRGVRIDVNGLAIAGAQSIWAAGTTLGISWPAPVLFYPLSVADYVEIKAFQESGAALNTQAATESQSRLEVRWIGP